MHSREESKKEQEVSEREDEENEEEDTKNVDYARHEMSHRKTFTTGDCIRKMFKAAIVGNTKFLKKLNEITPIRDLMRSNVAHLDDQGLTGLHYAARTCRLESIKFFIEELDASPSVEDFNGNTPLHLVADTDGEVFLHFLHDLKTKGSINDFVKNTEHLSEKKTDEMLEFLNNVLSPSTLEHITRESVKYMIFHPVILYLVQKAKVNIVNAKNNVQMTPLHYAVIRGNEMAVLQLILCKDIDIDVLDNNSFSPFALAASQNQLSVAKLLISLKADLKSKDEKKMIPLHRAVMANSLEMVTLILNSYRAYYGMKDINEFINNCDNSIRTPLNLAVSNGFYEIITYLIDNGADINVKTDELDSLLHVAARKDDPALVEYLLRTNKIPVNSTNTDERTPLHISALCKTKKVAEILIMNGADLEARDIRHRTPIMLAASTNSVDILLLLLHHGACINTLDTSFKSSIYLAVENNSFNAVNILVDHLNESNNKGFVNRGDLNSDTPLHRAAYYGRADIMSVGFTTARANIFAKNEMEETVLHKAVENGHIEATTMLLNDAPRLAGLSDQKGNTPLHRAAMNGHVAVIVKLCNAGINIHLHNIERETSLELAAAYGHLKAVKVLVKRGADVNAQDRSRLPALHLACKNGHVEMVNYLLKVGGDPALTVKVDDPKITNGSNALDIAIEKGNLHCAQAILNSSLWKSAMKNRVVSQKGTFDTPLRKAFRLMPELGKEMLDKFIIRDNLLPNDENLVIKYDFQYLEDSFSNWFSPDVDFNCVPSSSDALFYIKQLIFFSKKSTTTIQQKNKSRSIYDRETGLLLPTACPYVDDRQLLKKNHPLHGVVQALVSRKWHTLAVYVYLIDFLIYLTFLLLFSTYMLYSHPPYKFTFNGTAILNFTPRCREMMENDVVQYNPLNVKYKFVVFTMCFFRLSIELLQLISQGYHYFDTGNVLEVTLHVTTILVLIDFDDCSEITGLRQDWQWGLGACSLFLAWMVLLLFIRKIPFYGIYIILFFKVLGTFIKSSVMYALLMMAFSLTFNVLLSNHPPFQTVTLAALKAAAMTIGEIDHDGIFFGVEDGNYRTQIPYIIVTYIIYSLFMLLTCFIVMNLMVGLAVDDIKRALRESDLMRRTMQIHMTLTIEAALPITFTRRFIQRFASWQPNKKYKFGLIKWFKDKFNGYVHISENVQNQGKDDDVVILRQHTDDLTKKLESLTIAFNNLCKQMNKFLLEHQITAGNEEHFTFFNTDSFNESFDTDY